MLTRAIHQPFIYLRKHHDYLVLMLVGDSLVIHDSLVELDCELAGTARRMKGYSTY